MWEIKRRTRSNQGQITFEKEGYGVNIFLTSWIFAIWRTRGVDICLWIGSQQRRSSKGHRKLCNTEITYSHFTVLHFTDDKLTAWKNIAIKFSNAIRNVDSREEKQMQVLVIPLYFLLYSFTAINSHFTRNGLLGLIGHSSWVRDSLSGGES